MHNLIMLIKSVFNEHHNHYYYKCFQKNVHIDNTLIELMFLQVLMLIKQVHYKSALFVTTRTF